MTLIYGPKCGRYIQVCLSIEFIWFLSPGNIPRSRTLYFFFYCCFQFLILNLSFFLCRNAPTTSARSTTGSCSRSCRSSTTPSSSSSTTRFSRDSTSPNCPATCPKSYYFVTLIVFFEESKNHFQGTKKQSYFVVVNLSCNTLSCAKFNSFLFNNFKFFKC